ncbi:ComEC/Rec2 family competence protein [Pseudomonas koreensis]|uniref:MBL fold metallo-hydrolase n=1 Tax=Pseudomonas koreensis TaxID=198620 RepID=A0A9X2XSC7_9PSED|nr:MBL fold metallo-hydrolase [Pseudomonas koreensis]MCU7251922.1 MBL fold metallo-hydrolase [Pseudomonas koreensis]
MTTKDLELARRIRGDRSGDISAPSMSSSSVPQIQTQYSAMPAQSSLIQPCLKSVGGSMASDVETAMELEDDEKEEDVLLEVHYLDVGMGDSTLIICRKSGYTVLIDCGSTLNQKVAGLEALTFVRARLLALMHERKLPAPKIDRVYITHADRDHYNLLSALLHYKFDQGNDMPLIQVGSYCLGGQLSDYTAASANPFSGSETMHQFRKFVGAAKEFTPAFTGELPERIDEFVHVQVLSANVVPTHGETPVNASSLCILFTVRTEAGDKRLLFMGDAEKTVEAVLVTNHAATIKNCCALKLGHHGAEAGSNADFLKVVNPGYVFVSADMQWSHPYTSVVKRVLELPSMQRFGINDPSHTIVHGTGGSKHRAYSEQSISASLFSSLVGFETDTSFSDKAVKARKAGDDPVIATGVQHTLNICKDGAVGVYDAIAGEEGELVEL